MSLNMKNMNFTQWEKWISRCDVHADDHAPKAPHTVWVQFGECSGHFQYTPCIY